ncbi:MAG: EAL domain-containing protein [Actinomycetota bacterium]|nr:EAL domain-containing protein [Actinomycetota bacterium]
MPVATPAPPERRTMPGRAGARRVADWVRVRALRDPFVLLVGLWAAYVLVLPPLVGRGASETALVLAIGIFFLSLLARLVRTATKTRDRRAPLLLLAVGIALWGGGSAILNSAGDLTTVSFPAPGEALFLASYGGLFAFLLLDVPRRSLPPLGLGLETTVICGATACLAAFFVLTPLSVAFDRDGVPLLLALLYPMIDVVLAILVLAQLLLGQRDPSRRTVALVTGFLLLAVADSSFLVTLSSGTYVSSVTLDVLYGAGFGFVVTAALRRPAEMESVTRRDTRARTLVLAAAVALTALVLSPAGPVGWCVTVAAVLTLTSAGGRLAVALREAQGAAEALRLSRTDELTGLPNRRAVLQDLDEELQQDTPLTLMLLDLDGFKDINDSMGHGVGDRVLVLVAARLRSRFGHRLTVARLGGDEFALVARLDDEIEALEIGDEVALVLRDPLAIEGMQLSLAASIGIAMRTTNDKAATDLLRRADVAMYEAKSARVGALLYEASQDDFTRQRLHRTEELRRGIQEGELAMWYQPQVDAATQEVLAVEALVRWQHPDEGLLTPAAFLPEARRNGLMPALSVEVVRQVVAAARQWVDEGFEFRVALNCAPPEILGGVVLPYLFDKITEADLPIDSLLIEVTEDSFIADPARARERLLELRDMYVQSAIDDYGTGFSSLAYLRDLPVRELKMDRSFIATLLTDPSSRVIVDTTTRMAHSLGLRLVAEGVEDAATAAELVRMDIDILQGYHIAPPMPMASVGPWVRQWSATLNPEPVSDRVSLPQARDAS